MLSITASEPPLKKSNASTDVDNTNALQELDIKDSNILINIDNIAAMTKLKSSHMPPVAMVYLDPPYCTGQILPHYNDQWTSSEWENTLESVVRLSHQLLNETGSLWISISRNKINNVIYICNSVFKIENFVCKIIWIKSNHFWKATRDEEYILIYAKNKKSWQSNLQLNGNSPFERADPQVEAMKLNENLPPPKKPRYTNSDNDPRGPWIDSDLTCRYSITARPNLYYPISNPAYSEISYFPTTTRVWAYSKESMEKLINNNEILFPLPSAPPGTLPRKKRFPRARETLLKKQESASSNQNNLEKRAKSPAEASRFKRRIPAPSEQSEEEDRWGKVAACPHSSSLTERHIEEPISLTWQIPSQQAREEMIKLFPNDPFCTPKPEALIEKMLQVGTKEGDIVLDCYAGSGTTGAVATRLKRRWIMIEQNKHTCDAFIVPRMLIEMDKTKNHFIYWTPNTTTLYPK